MCILLNSSFRLPIILRSLISLFFLLSFIFIVSCEEEVEPSPPYQYSVPITDNDGWETDSIQAVGLDLVPLENMMNSINRSNDTMNIHSILIIKNGKLVFEEYFWGWTFNSDNPDNCKGTYVLYNRNFGDSLCSVTKSFTGALIGIAIDYQFIKNENERLFSCFQDYSYLNDDERKNRIEIRHLLSNTSGLYWPEMDFDNRDPRNPLAGLWAAEDPIRFILDRPMVYEPGEMFNYSSGNANILGEIIRRASGMDAAEFSSTYLFSPLGISNMRWRYLANGVVYTSGDLYLRPRDMAKFGELILDGGVWKGIRIISEDYIKRSLQEVMNNYGYTWWIQSFQIEGHTVQTQSARGWGGQYIFLVPEKEMVVVLTAGNYEGDDYAMDYFLNNILPSAY